MDDFAADIDAFMEAVGIDEVTLVGHSSGGLIVQRVALSYPRRVSRLVLIGSPTTLVNNEALIELGEEMLALEDPIPPEFVMEFVESTIHHPVPEEFVAGAVSECLKAQARDRGADVDLVGKAGRPPPARRAGATRGSDPRCHFEGVPRNRSRGGRGAAGVGRVGSGGVHVGHTAPV